MSSKGNMEIVWGWILGILGLFVGFGSTSDPDLSGIGGLGFIICICGFLLVRDGMKKKRIYGKVVRSAIAQLTDGNKKISVGKIHYETAVKQDVVVEILADAKQNSLLANDIEIIA